MGDQYELYTWVGGSESIPDVVRIFYPDAPCMEHLPTFTIKSQPNVGKYTKHGACGIYTNLILRFNKHVEILGLINT